MSSPCWSEKKIVRYAFIAISVYIGVASCLDEGINYNKKKRKKNLIQFVQWVGNAFDNIWIKEPTSLTKYKNSEIFQRIWTEQTICPSFWNVLE